MTNGLAFWIFFPINVLFSFIQDRPRFYIQTKSGLLFSMSGGYMDECQEPCQCQYNSFTPVCGIDNVVYYSPCHAGCTSQAGVVSWTDICLLLIFSYFMCIFVMAIVRFDYVNEINYNFHWKQVLLKLSCAKADCPNCELFQAVKKNWGKTEHSYLCE